MAGKIKIVILGILCALLACPFVCVTAEGEKMMPEKLSDYLYYMELDDYTFEGMPREDSPLFNVGCSSIRKGSLYGRNLDLQYCEIPEFVISVSGGDGRFASIGVCADPTITCNVTEMSEAELLSMPNITNDGINENGVVISENVVEATAIDEMKGTAPGKEKVHASRVVRYLLDRAESAERAVELMREIDIVGGFAGYGIHWMIADIEDTFVVEIIHGKLSVSKNEKYYMTNFYLNYGPSQEKQEIAGTEFQDVPLLNDYALGVERWCVLRDSYNGIENAQDMADLLASVRATAMYDTSKQPLWYSECVGELSIHDDKAAFDAELNRQIGLFDQRSRTEPNGAWITWHSSVYALDQQALYVYSQEDYSHCFDFRR